MGKAEIDQLAGRFHVECVIAAAQHLFVIGWVNDSILPVTRIETEHPTGRRGVHRLDGSQSGGAFVRTLRPDVHRALEMPPSVDARLGFVAALCERVNDGDSFGLAFDNAPISPQVVTALRLENSTKQLASLLTHSGYALRKLAEELGYPEVAHRIDAIENHRKGLSTRQLIAVDYSIVFAGSALLVHGWIAALPKDIGAVRIKAGAVAVDARVSLAHVYRPDLLAGFPDLPPGPLGFFLLLDQENLICAAELTLEIEIGGQAHLVQFMPEVGGWVEVLRMLRHCPNLREPLLAAMRASGVIRELAGFERDVAWLQQESLLSLAASFPTSVNNDASVHAAVDRVIACGDSVLIVVGWIAEAAGQIRSVRLVVATGQETELSQSLVRISRGDVRDGLKERIPHLNEKCGFMFCAEVSAAGRSVHALRIEMDNGCIEWLQLRPTERVVTGEALLRAVSQSIGDLSKLDVSIFDLFEAGLGNAVEGLNVRTGVASKTTKVRQFGQPHDAPDVSVIVPLYGRYDFLRHQLAQFADDPDFARVDLIYVVDDPGIVANALSLAAHYASLFRVPFRVAHYGTNLGYAGANNVGAAMATADTLVLLNSDVIPTRVGWVAELRRALFDLSEAAAVGPLLLFADGSIQHAGMEPIVHPDYPGFIWNSHPGKGTAWRQGDLPQQQSMLTGACLMLKKKCFFDCGGFDDGYLVGDFEDSDLCLKLRKVGKKLWLIPGTKLWHLERQSLRIGAAPGQRRLTTIYNGWRYRNLIARGELADPFVM